MKYLIRELTKPFFSVLEIIVLVTYAQIAFGNASLFSPRFLIAAAALLPVMATTLFIEGFIRGFAGVPKG